MTMCTTERKVGILKEQQDSLCNCSVVLWNWLVSRLEM